MKPECNSHQKQLIKYMIGRCINVFDLEDENINIENHCIKICIYKKDHRSITLDLIFYESAPSGVNFHIDFRDSKGMRIFTLMDFLYNEIEINTAIKACEYIISTTPCIYEH
jgi:biotin carboxylase